MNLEERMLGFEVGVLQGDEHEQVKGGGVGGY